MRRSEARVYFVLAAQARLIKIGFAANTAERLKSLQVGAPEPLRLLAELPGGPAREAELHRRFAAYRMQGFNSVTMGVGLT